MKLLIFAGKQIPLTTENVKKCSTDSDCPLAPCHVLFLTVIAIIGHCWGAADEGRSLWLSVDGRRFGQGLDP